MVSPRPWNALPIADSEEPLVELPASILRIEPHPYQSLGAPYGEGASPFRLRADVVERLLRADQRLGSEAAGLRLAIFDAWRPVAVQRFMVDHTIAEECRRRGLDAAVDGPELQAVHLEVARFWALPSLDPTMPPPHSTGAAVDLTLADGDGLLLEMGGAIDAIDSVSEPDHHRVQAERDPGSEAALWHRRRVLLNAVMESAGFRRHPCEWWHFSHGDQLWAWQQGLAAAHYGRAPVGVD